MALMIGAGVTFEGGWKGLPWTSTIAAVGAAASAKISMAANAALGLSK